MAGGLFVGSVIVDARVVRGGYSPSARARCPHRSDPASAGRRQRVLLDRVSEPGDLHPEVVEKHLLALLASHAGGRLRTVRRRLGVMSRIAHPSGRVRAASPGPTTTW
jgi:hypothetical protein